MAVKHQRPRVSLKGLRIRLSLYPRSPSCFPDRRLSLVPSYMDLLPEEAVLHIVALLGLRDLVRFAGVSRRYREMVARSKYLMELDLR